MKVILLQDVKALGKKGDVVNVSDGYARNAIFPKKLGVEANAKNLNDLKLQNQHADKVAQENYREDLMEETLIKRSMPNSLDAEQSVIGSMIMDKDAILTAMEMLTSDDFYHKQYGILFDAMIELYSKGLPVDLITLQNKLKEKEVPEEISSLSYVKELLDAVPTSANIKYYAKIVKDNSMRRRLIRLNEEIENECYAGKESIDMVMDMTEKKVFDLLSTRGGGGDYVPIRQVVMNALKMQQRLPER